MYHPAENVSAGVFFSGPPHAQSVVSAIGSGLPNWNFGFEDMVFSPG